MYEYAELRTNALLRYVQRLERNKQAMSSAVSIVFMLDVCWWVYVGGACRC